MTQPEGTLTITVKPGQDDLEELLRRARLSAVREGIVIDHQELDTITQMRAAVEEVERDTYSYHTTS